MLRNTKQVLGSFATLQIVGFGGTSLAHELFMIIYLRWLSFVVHGVLLLLILLHLERPGSAPGVPSEAKSTVYEVAIRPATGLHRYPSGK
jgi:hypothetical protein